MINFVTNSGTDMRHGSCPVPTRMVSSLATTAVIFRERIWTAISSPQMIKSVKSAATRLSFCALFYSQSFLLKCTIGSKCFWISTLTPPNQVSLFMRPSQIQKSKKLTCNGFPRFSTIRVLTFSSVIASSLKKSIRRIVHVWRSIVISSF